SQLGWKRSGKDLSSPSRQSASATCASRGALWPANRGLLWELTRRAWRRKRKCGLALRVSNLLLLGNLVSDHVAVQIWTGAEQRRSLASPRFFRLNQAMSKLRLVT